MLIRVSWNNSRLTTCRFMRLLNAFNTVLRELKQTPHWFLNWFELVWHLSKQPSILVSVMVCFDLFHSSFVLRCLEKNWICYCWRWWHDFYRNCLKSVIIACNILPYQPSLYSALYPITRIAYLLNYQSPVHEFILMVYALEQQPHPLGCTTPKPNRIINIQSV